MTDVQPPDHLSPEEQERWRQIWALERPSAGATERAFDGERGVVRVRDRIHDRISDPGLRPARHYVTGGLVVAALVVCLCVVSVFSGGRAQIYTTLPGQRLNAQLSDGTRIVLGPESRLRVPAGYGGGRRSVDLEGEGYFAVIHDARHPFAVLTHNLQINDVGTEFDVRAYDDDIRVTVTRGSVVVGAGRGAARRLGGSRPRPSPPQKDAPSLQDISLAAGDMINVTNGVPTVTHHANLAAATVWLQGGLAFTDTPLREVIQDLSRTFGVEIHIADTALSAKRITSTFTHEPIDQILDVVTQIVGARYDHVGRTVVIRRDSTATAPASSTPPTLTTVRR